MSWFRKKKESCICIEQVHPVYGFAPEADCPDHDTREFHDFVRKIKGYEHQKCNVGCPYYNSGHSIDAGGFCNMGCC